MSGVRCLGGSLLLALGSSPVCCFVDGTERSVWLCGCMSDPVLDEASYVRWYACAGHESIATALLPSRGDGTPTQSTAPVSVRAATLLRALGPLSWASPHFFGGGSYLWECGCKGDPSKEAANLWWTACARHCERTHRADNAEGRRSPVARLPAVSHA